MLKVKVLECQKKKKKYLTVRTVPKPIENNLSVKKRENQRA